MFIQIYGEDSWETIQRIEQNPILIKITGEEKIRARKHVCDEHRIYGILNNDIKLDHTIPCYDPNRCFFCLGKRYNIPILEVYNNAFSEYCKINTKTREDFISRVVSKWERRGEMKLRSNL